MKDDMDPMEPEAGVEEDFAGADEEITIDDSDEVAVEDAVGEVNEEVDDDAEEEGGSFGSRSRTLPVTPPALQESIASLDALLAEADEPEKIQAGMGIRLALGMAQELKAGKSLGTETADLVAGWVLTYGSDVVEGAVKVAREFLIKPEEMRKVLGDRLGMGNPE